jgi:phosphoserine phosphatase
VWAVSSTNDWVLEEGLRDFGIPAGGMLCTRVAVENGILTSRLLDVPSGAGKAAALERAGVRRPDLVFGNSIHDAAMLRLARIPFAVNPTEALTEEAVSRGWNIYLPPQPQAA